MLITTDEVFELQPYAVAITRAYNKRPITPEKLEKSVVKRVVKQRDKFVANLRDSGTDVLFEEAFDVLSAPIYCRLLDLLRAPLCPNVKVPKGYSSDIRGVDVVEVVDGDDDALGIDIPYTPWGQPWFKDRHGVSWSQDGVMCLQVKLFWRSLDELALSNNELEKWSVLRWIFRPPIWKHYVYQKKLGKSLCFPVHERDDPFSFHNCCIAARMVADVVREGVRRNVSAEVIKAVDKFNEFV